jgi:hypothetical protein
MNSKIRSGIFILLLACSSYNLLAQVSVQPGQLAAFIAGSQPDGITERDPIRFSPDGVITTNHMKPIAHVDGNADRRAATVWKLSIAAMLGATAMDAATSVGKNERNPILRSSDGMFGGRGIAIKSSLAALCIVPQILLRNHREFRKPFIIANFVNTGIFTFAVAHNAALKPAHR